MVIGRDVLRAGRNARVRSWWDMNMGVGRWRWYLVAGGVGFWQMWDGVVTRLAVGRWGMVELNPVMGVFVDDWRLTPVKGLLGLTLGIVLALNRRYDLLQVAYWWSLIVAAVVTLGAVVTVVWL